MKRSPRPSTPFFFNDTATTEIYTLSLHDALPILRKVRIPDLASAMAGRQPHHCVGPACRRSEEHTSELQSHLNLVCRLLLEKKKTEQRRDPPTARSLSPSRTCRFPHPTCPIYPAL